MTIDNDKIPDIETANQPSALIILAGVVLLCLLNCKPQTSTIKLPLDSTLNFSHSGEVESPDRWWIVFGDETLNLLVDSAFNANFNLESAWQRLQVARAIVDRESAAFLPDLVATVQGEVSRPQSGLEVFVENQRLRFGLSSEYEVDLWGRIQASVDADRYRARASLGDYQAAMITISAEIARTWYQLMEGRNQLDLIEVQIETNEKVLKLIRARFGSGQVRAVDILRQRQLLESTKEQQIQMESRVEVLEHQLAVLTGGSPLREYQYQVNPLPDLPPLPDTGIPVSLIQRRPDVRAAYHLLQAADQELAAAISNKYPRFTLSARMTSSADQFERLFRDWAWSIAGNLLAPVFNGGRLRAEVDRSESFKYQRFNEYGQTVLTALQEVEDALIREEKQKEVINNLEDQSVLALQAQERLRLEYFNGFGNYIDVLTALDQEQQVQRDLLTAKMLLLEYRISLYRALAGKVEISTQ